MSKVVYNIFKNRRIAPDVIERIPESILPLEVEYGNQKVDGSELTPRQVKDKPKVSWDADENELYTLIFTGLMKPGMTMENFFTSDPDSGSAANFLHWMVVNIPGNKIENGHIAFDYIGSGPPKGSGLHRYIFLVYRQRTKIKESRSVSSTSISGRLFFNPLKFPSKNGLEGPVAGNLYETQYDEFVDVFKEQFLTFGNILSYIGQLLGNLFCCK